VGEVNIPIIHCLVALPSVKKEDIKRVYGHPGALAQCSTYLKDLNAVREAVFDTAYGAKLVHSEQLADTAAIASEEAAEQYGLQVLEKNIHDKERGVNIQRYLILARDPAEYDEAFTYKTSLVFTLDEGSGQLFKALSVFALREMSISKIESRPLRSNPILATEEGTRQFNYIFFLDYIGHTSELKCKQAMRHLQEITPFFKVLGSYPIDSNKTVVGLQNKNG
jgi:arogenate/prephenate dehydratase